MKLEPLGNPEGLGVQGHQEMRVNLESLALQERKERLVMREMQDQMALQEKGVVLEREDPGGLQACGGREETRAKLDHKVTRDEKALLVSLETQVTLAPSDLKDTEVMRVPQDLRVSEEPQDPPGPLETLG